MVKTQKTFWRVFFAVAACSWMPHWTCHYYVLETRSRFVAGSWEFSRADSAMMLALYGALIVLNLAAVASGRFRFPAALVSGACHAALGFFHIFRLFRPFRFEVFGYEWSMGASLRETLIELAAGAAFLWAAKRLYAGRATANTTSSARGR